MKYLLLCDILYCFIMHDISYILYAGQHLLFYYYLISLGHLLGHCIQIYEVGSTVLILKLQKQRLGLNNLPGVMELFHA